MRKIIALEFITLDGVIQAPGGSQEDTLEGFKYGGWQGPYFDDFLGKVMEEQMREPFDLLLGRKTYDIFAGYWPHHESAWPGVNAATKYVASHDASLKLDWSNSVLLTGDVAEEVKKLKTQSGPKLQVYGSGNLIQTLLKHDLVDAFWLKIFPITLGTGKRLFVEGTIPAAFKLTDGKISPKGVIVANYERAGEVKTESFS
jgi:dihydrofolate reductase